MFSLREYIVKGIKNMVGKEPDYKVIEYSTKWLDKGTLAQSDISEIQALIDNKNANN